MPQELEAKLAPKRASESATEMVQVVLPNDANPLGFILGGTVMHLIDIAGAIACHRHTRTLLVTAAVDDLQFLHSIKVGDLIILKSHVTCAFLTFVAIDRDGAKVRIPPLLVETEAEKQVCADAQRRRAARLQRKVKTTS